MDFLTIYLAVWAILALGYGYFSDQINLHERKKEDDFDPTAIAFACWPLMLLLGILMSPIWVPVAISEFGRWIKRRKERNRAVNNFIKQLPLNKEK